MTRQISRPIFSFPDFVSDLSLSAPQTVEQQLEQHVEYHTNRWYKERAREFLKTLYNSEINVVEVAISGAYVPIGIDKKIEVIARALKELDS